MRQTEIIKTVAENQDCERKTIKNVIDLLHKLITYNAAKHYSITIPHLGTFYTKLHKEHAGYLPQQKKKALFPKSYKFHFRPASDFKKEIEELKK